MIFLSKSLNNEKFKNDKKLSLYKRGIINITQFVNLIDKNDDYILFGPAIIDKSKIKEFIDEWKENPIIFDEIKNKKEFSPNEIIANINKIRDVFPEISKNIEEYKVNIKNASCEKCVKNKFLYDIASIISSIKDNRDTTEISDIIDSLLYNYSNLTYEIASENEFDIEWIKPESLLGIGYDIINNLNSCLDCALKHIGRAKILFEEFMQGYQNYKDIIFDELTKGNKAAEELYVKYLDSCAQLDMGSSELVGNIEDLNKKYVYELLELATEIRKIRISFQNDINIIPDFDSLRISIKKLQLKISKENNINNFN